MIRVHFSTIDTVICVFIHMDDGRNSQALDIYVSLQKCRLPSFFRVDKLWTECTCLVFVNYCFDTLPASYTWLKTATCLVIDARQRRLRSA